MAPLAFTLRNTAQCCPQAEPLASTRYQAEQKQVRAGYPLQYQGFTTYRRWRSPASETGQSPRGDRLSRSRWNRIAASLGVPAMRFNQVRKGRLETSDDINRRRRRRFADDYLLRSKKTSENQFIRVQLRSRNFDTYLQIFDAETDKLLLSNDDHRHGNRFTFNSHLTLALQPDRTYRIRVTSYGERETGRYTLKSRKIASRNQNFSFAYGAGVIDARAAASRVLDDFTLSDAIPEPGSAAWNLEQIRAPDVWEQGITGQDVVVAVIDTGVDLAHPDLTQNLWRNPGEIAGNGIDDDGNGFIDDVQGWDFVGNDERPGDRSYNFSGHGTHVAGIVAAAQNDLGITGVAPDAQIMPVRVLDRNGSGTARDVAKGIHYAAANGADVINLSLGSAAGSTPNRRLRRALKFARRQGVTVAIAAGNERETLGAKRSGEPAFWAATRDAGIAVGAIDRKRTIAPFSNPTGNRSRMNFIVAPGVRVESLAPTWTRRRLGISLETRTLSGTSMATPHVAGAIALMLSANPDLTPPQIAQILAETASTEDLTAI